MASGEIDPNWPPPVYQPSDNIDTTPPSSQPGVRGGSGRVIWLVVALVAAVCVGVVAIKAEVAAAIGSTSTAATATTTPAKPSPSTVVDVVNAGSISGLASQVSNALRKRGYTTDQVRDRKSGDPAATTIKYGPGAQADAMNLGTLLGIDAPKQPDASIEPGHIQVTVDTNFSMPAPDDSDDDTTTYPKPNAYYNGGDDSSSYPAPDHGQPIDGGGVPCVN